MTLKGAPAASGSNSGAASVGASNPAVSSSSTSSKFPKNALGNKSDVAWRHGSMEFQLKKQGRCKYCQKVYTGRAYQLKHHLAGTYKDAEPCRGVPNDVKKEKLNIVTILQQKLIQKSSSIEESMEIGDKKRKTNDMEVIGVERSGNIFRKRGVSSQNHTQQQF